MTVKEALIIIQAGAMSELRGIYIIEIVLKLEI